MSREIVNMVHELDENHSTLVAQSLSMAVAMLRGRESQDIFPKKKAAISSRENGSYLKRRKKMESDGTGALVQVNGNLNRGLVHLSQG